MSRRTDLRPGGFDLGRAAPGQVVTDAVVRGILDGERTFAGPEHVVVDITNRCNYRCVACWTFSPLLGDKKPPAAWYRQELPGALVERLLDDLAALGTKIVRFTGGGEPFLHPDLLPLVERAAARGLRLDITTNASKLTRESSERLVRAGMGELAVSLWAADRPSFAATHPTTPEGDFDRTVDALRYLSGIRRNRVELVLLNVISKANYERVASMFELALALNADRAYFTLVDPIAGATDVLLLDPAERAHVLEQVRWIDDRLARERPGRIKLDFWDGFKTRLAAGGASAGDYDAEAVERIPCYIGWYFCRVLATGEVVPCCRGVAMPMGNLHERSFQEIWENARYGEFRKNALTKSKHDPYFAPIACHRMCDNLMHNEMLDARVRSVTNG